MLDDDLRKVDLYTPNFDIHIKKLLSNPTPEQMEGMPTRLSFKISKAKEDWLDKLNFEEKMWMLSVLCKHDVIIITQGEDGIGPKDFKAAIQAQKGTIKNVELLENGQVPALFIQGDPELMKALRYMNYVYCNDLFAMLNEIHPSKRSKRGEKFNKFQRSYGELLRMINNYEAKKKGVLRSFGMSATDLYALLYCSDGEKSGKEFYTTVYRQAFNSSRGNLGVSIAKMYHEGNLNRRGKRQHYKYSITSKGMTLLQKVLDKLLFNF